MIQSHKQFSCLKKRLVLAPLVFDFKTRSPPNILPFLVCLFFFRSKSSIFHKHGHHMTVFTLVIEIFTVDKMTSPFPFH